MKIYISEERKISMNIIYKALTRDDINKLKQLDRYEVINEKYYYSDGSLALKKEYEEIKEFEPDTESWIASFQNNYDKGGIFFGAFHNERLVGIAALSGERIGKEKDAIQLDTLFVDKNHRKQGIGAKLVAMLREKAIQLNAKKMYVSSSESKNTVNFYMGTGFSVINGRIEELFDEDCLDDIHMEVVL